MIAQYLGAFLGAALVFFTYKVIVCKIFFFAFGFFAITFFLRQFNSKSEVDNHRMQLICSPVLLGIIRFLLIRSFFLCRFFQISTGFWAGWRGKCYRWNICHFSRAGHLKLQWSSRSGFLFCPFLVWQVTISTLLAFFSSFNQRWLVLLCCFLPSAPSTIRQTLPSPPGIATLILATIWRWIWFEICFAPALVHSW